MIESVWLLNWRSHKDSVLEFRNGTNLLVGIMGSGKSSVLDGISFALFGTFPSVERKRVKLEDIIRFGENSARVAVELRWKDSLLKIIRKITKTKRGVASEAEIFRDGALVEKGARAVTSKVEELLGIDYELFTRAIYSEQNNIDYFLTIDPRRRKGEIDSLLGLDRFERARANIVTVINRIKSNRRLLEERFDEKRKKEVEEGIAKKSEELKVAEAEFRKLSEKVESEGKGVEEEEKRMEKENEKRRKFDELSKNLIEFRTRISSIEKEIKGKKFGEDKLKEKEDSLQKLQQERKQLTENVHSFEKENSGFSKKLGRVESGIERAKEAAKRTAELKKKVQEISGGEETSEIKSGFEKTENELLSLSSEQHSKNKELSEARESVSRLKPGLSKCPLCDTPLTEEGIVKVRREKTESVAGIRKRLEEIEKRIGILKKNKQELSKKIDYIGKIMHQLPSLEKEAAALETLSEEKEKLMAVISENNRKKKEFLKRLDGINPGIELLGVEISNLKILLRKKDELSGLKVRKESSEKMLSELEFDEKGFEERRKTLEKRRITLERLASEKRSAKEKMKSSADLLAVLKNELGGIHLTEAKIRSYTKLGEELLVYKNALLETQLSLRESLIDAINRAMNDVWGIFYPYRNYVTLRLRATEKDYLFEVYDGEQWRVLESIASGGERASAALTLRVALAMVLTPNLSWLILDEPTHNLDRDAVELLSNTLQLKVPDVVRQTFVITHDEGLMGSEFASSYKLTRDKEHNGETRTEKL